VLRTAKPKFFMPVHGEYRHLKKHIELAGEAGVPFENCFLIENGDSLTLNGESTGVYGQVQSGRDYVCQGGVFNSMGDIYRTRLNVAKNGLVVANFVVKERSLELACSPLVLNKGVPFDEGKFAKELKRIFDSTVNNYTNGKDRKKISLQDIHEDLRLQIRRALEREVRYKCNVSVLLSRVGA
jgi:ribonuclease J